jgi:hypothetical protein
MKKIILSISIFVSSFTFYQCQDEKIEAASPSTQEKVKVLLNGKPSTLDAVSKQSSETLQVMVDNTLNTFTDEKMFIEWLNTQGESGQKTLESYRSMEKAQKFIEDNDIKEKYEKTGVMPSEYNAFIKENFNSSISNKSARPSAMFVILYDNPYESGDWVAGAIMPTIGGMNNRAESAYLYGAGVTALCDKTWFSGSKLWVVGFGYYPYENLNDIDWENRIGSFFYAT